MDKAKISRPLATAIVVLVPLAVIAWHWLALLSRPPHLDEIVAELGSIGRFMGEPVPNHAGTKLLFIETTEHGYGTYLADVASGKRTLLFEQAEQGAAFGDVNESFLGWAPDDSCFAYVRTNNAWQIVICDGKSGETQAVVPVNHHASSGVWFDSHQFAIAETEEGLQMVRQINGQWVRPLPFKYFRETGHKAMTGQARRLTICGADSVAWQEGGGIWKCGLESGAPENVLGKGTTATMDTGTENKDSTWYEIGYNPDAPATGLPAHGSTFVSETLPDHFYTMAPDYTAANAVLIDSEVLGGALTLKAPSIFSKLSFLTAAGNGAVTVGYAIRYADGAMERGTFVAPDWFSDKQAAFVANGRHNDYPNNCEAVNSGFPRLFAADAELAKSNSPITQIQFFHVSGPGHAAIFAVSGATNITFSPISVIGYNVDLIQEAIPTDKLALAEKEFIGASQASPHGRNEFAVASLYGEAPAIWQHVSDSQTPRCVVPNVEKPFRYVKNAPIEEGLVTNAAGDKLTYYLLTPANNVAGARHPLVLAILGMNEMGFTWSHNHEAFANCGAYFVSVDRRGRGYEQWAKDVLSIYQALACRLAVDTNDVWLYADSVGAAPVYSLLYDQPALWRGAILFSPGGFPDPAQVRHKRLFFDCGGSDGDLAQRATQFQDEAAKEGTPITLLIHPGLQHTYRLPQLERERMREALVVFGSN